jgi:hypothetical protein
MLSGRNVCGTTSWVPTVIFKSIPGSTISKYLLKSFPSCTLITFENSLMVCLSLEPLISTIRFSMYMWLYYQLKHRFLFLY